MRYSEQYYWFGKFPAMWSGALSGKLSSPQAVLFGKFGRSQMRWIYSRQYSKSYFATLSSRGGSHLPPVARGAPVNAPNGSQTNGAQTGFCAVHGRFHP